MKELFDLLEKGERKILILMCVLLVAALIFHQGFAQKQKNNFRNSVESLPRQKKEFASREELNKEIKTEWMLWECLPLIILTSFSVM